MSKYYSRLGEKILSSQDQNTEQGVWRELKFIHGVFEFKKRMVGLMGKICGWCEICIV